MLRSCLVVSLVMFAAFSSHAESAPFNILSHNVFWLQGYPFEGTDPGAPNPVILDRLNAMYAEVQPDIFCLQEIQSPEAAATAAGGKTYFYTPGQKYPAYGAMITAPKERQLENVSIPDDFKYERSVVVTKVKTHRGATLTIASLHLPSGRQGGGSPTEIRGREVAEFLKHFGKDVDVIVGDFNEGPGGNVSKILSENGFSDCALIKEGSDTNPTTVWNKRGDFIWIKNSLKDRLLDFKVLRDKNPVSDLPGKKLLSDHNPLMISLDM